MIPEREHSKLDIFLLGEEESFKIKRFKFRMTCNLRQNVKSSTKIYSVFFTFLWNDFWGNVECGIYLAYYIGNSRPDISREKNIIKIDLKNLTVGAHDGVSFCMNRGFSTSPPK